MPTSFNSSGLIKSKIVYSIGEIDVSTNPIQFQDEGVNLGNNLADTVDFVGAAVTATRVANKVTVTITGTGGGDQNIDGGNASSIYLPSQLIDGGGA
jgi:hypothetical protein